MLNLEKAYAIADHQDLVMANMTVEPHQMCEETPFHFSQEYKDVALRHVWTRAQAARALEITERGIPRWI